MRRLENATYGLMFIVAIAICCFLPVTRAQKTDPSEVKALRAIQRNLNDPMKNLNWTKGDPCMSKWNGVLCFNTTREDGFLHVRVLQLLNMNLSGSLAPELGQLSHMEILDFMWNKISGNIPKEIGKISSLKLLLLNGNELSGSLPEEIGNLSNLDRIQIDQNHISGPLPLSFAKLGKVKHFHMNNNSISGQIPVEYSQLPNILHILLDNNNLTGNLPTELSELPNLQILQLDNNNFSGASIPSSYGKMKKLMKLSLRNCSLQGPVPDLSDIPQFGYLDLSSNQLSGSIPTNKLSNNITTIDLSNNKLNGSIPSNYSGFPFLQKLSLRNNLLTGSVLSTIWQDVDLHPNGTLVLDFENNNLTAITGVLQPPPNVTIMLWGNPLCAGNVTQYCQPQNGGQITSTSTNSSVLCLPQSCPTELFFEYNRASPLACFCAAPIRIGYRLKSPGFVDFNPYVTTFELYLTSRLNLSIFQLDIDSVVWEEGPRLRMYLKIFPKNLSIFNSSEISQFRLMFTQWMIPDLDVFGPYEVLNFTLLGPYKDDNQQAPAPSTLSKGAMVGIIFGVIAIVTGLAIVSMLIVKRKIRNQHQLLIRKRKSPRLQIKIDGLKDFTFEEMSLATNGFSNALLVGQGGYGKVYKGILADGTEVAIKRAREGSLQGSKEFFTEIELLSRLHHRNLVSLLGYCDEQDEQMLVYEFMLNGTLRDHLSVKSGESLSFYLRLRLALDSAKGILYLHTEVDPPVIHRDIKATNILLDSKFIAKVADFGLSRLAPLLDIEGSGQGHISTVVKGTPGYLDPEYFLTHKLTDKSDVYSLGVVFMELLTGMLPISYGKNIVREVNTARQAGILHTVIDAQMVSYPLECVERFLLLALKCCHEETDERPSMSEVVRELENIKLMVPAAHAAYSTPSDSIATDTSEVTSTDIFTPPSMADEHAYRSSNILGSNYTGGDLTTVRPR